MNGTPERVRGWPRRSIHANLRRQGRRLLPGSVVDLPDRLGTPGAPGSIVTKGGLVFVGGWEDVLYAFDKRTGREVWSAPLPERSTATPMTYRTEKGRQFVLIATGSGASQELVAFAPPE